MSIWKDIPGYEGYYQASNDGLIRSVTKTVRQRGEFTQVKKGKILSTCVDRLGYVRCALSRENKLKSFIVHRLVALAFIDNPNGYKEVNHKDGIKTNNNIDNLEWCDRGHNIRHAVRTGLIVSKRGSDSPNSKFSNDQRQEIASMMRSGIPYAVVAKKMNCHFATIYRILNSLK